MDILHILNGDSTAASFEHTGLTGDVMVWREVLSEGPLQQDITSASFWRERSNWITGAFNVPSGDHQQNVLNELAKLDDAYDELNLWFEFDLHCQANLLGVLACINQKTDLSRPAVYLICPGDYPGKENFRGMGELNSQELEYLYDNIRVQLSEIDFIIAAEAWALLVSGDSEKLSTYLNTTSFWGSLHLLKPALQAHLKRLQTNDKGLNYIEQKLMDIYSDGYTTSHEIYAKFWESEKIYGMGDMEIDLYLRQLKHKGLISE
jgi:hypothetical protein